MAPSATRRAGGTDGRYISAPSSVLPPLPTLRPLPPLQALPPLDTRECYQAEVQIECSVNCAIGALRWRTRRSRRRPCGATADELAPKLRVRALPDRPAVQAGQKAVVEAPSTSADAYWQSVAGYTDSLVGAARQRESATRTDDPHPGLCRPGRTRQPRSWAGRRQRCRRRGVPRRVTGYGTRLPQ